jgi:hypothetical protein
MARTHNLTVLDMYYETNGQVVQSNIQVLDYSRKRFNLKW